MRLVSGVGEDSGDGGCGLWLLREKKKINPKGGVSCQPAAGKIKTKEGLAAAFGSGRRRSLVF